MNTTYSIILNTNNLLILCVLFLVGCASQYSNEDALSYYEQSANIDALPQSILSRSTSPIGSSTPSSSESNLLPIWSSESLNKTLLAIINYLLVTNPDLGVSFEEFAQDENAKQLVSVEQQTYSRTQFIGFLFYRLQFNPSGYSSGLGDTLLRTIDYILVKNPHIDASLKDVLLAEREEQMFSFEGQVAYRIRWIHFLFSRI